MATRSAATFARRQGDEKRYRQLIHEREDLAWQLLLSLAGMGKIKWLEGHSEQAAILLVAAEALANAGDLLPFYWFTEEWQEIMAKLRPVVDERAWDQGQVCPWQRW